PLYYFLTYNKNKNIEKILFYGARESSHIYFQNELISLTDKCYFVTEDGLLGEKGMVNEELRKFFILSEPRGDDLIMACGPKPMIKEIINFAHSEKIKCLVSLESYMGCGTGVCLSCVVPSNDLLEAGEKYFQVCCEGPVVDSRRINPDFFEK
ncbi:dihydroorotate dehydrogenase electron transfer subunit, partial [bacterium]|nr:dihydroorotate dehydrogenase electron transfer subunit [bacterium]